MEAWTQRRYAETTAYLAANHWDPAETRKAPARVAACCPAGLAGANRARTSRRHRPRAVSCLDANTVCRENASWSAGTRRRFTALAGGLVRWRSEPATAERSVQAVYRPSEDDQESRLRVPLERGTPTWPWHAVSRTLTSRGRSRSRALDRPVVRRCVDSRGQARAVSPIRRHGATRDGVHGQVSPPCPATRKCSGVTGRRGTSAFS